MQIGEVIRKYRKEKNMTQEEMANRLGVTAPAVNKWENGNSLPDITLLAPIARLLNISLDTLLAFREELTPEEIRGFILEADERFEKNTYEEVFQWAKGVLEQYPNCEWLILQMAVVLDARRLTQEIPDSQKYDDYIMDCYVRVLNSRDEKIRTSAADSLFGFYTRKEQYDKAEEYLAYYSDQNPEKKRKQAEIYSKTKRVNEAYKAYEELLFSSYQMLSMVFHSIYLLAMQDNNLEKAQKLVEKQQELAKLFEMGQYQQVSGWLEFVTAKKDVDATIEIMEKLLVAVDDIMDYSKSNLYEHMTFKEPREELIKKIRQNLLDCFQDEETYGYMKGNERWRELR